MTNLLIRSPEGLASLPITTLFFEDFLTTCFIFDRIYLEISKSDKDFPGIFSNVPLIPEIDFTRTINYHFLLHSWPGLIIFPQ